MGERCGCVSKECTCGIFQGDGIIIGGTGSETNPHIVEVGPTSTKVVGVPSSYVNVTVTGLGTGASPYVVKMVKSVLNPPAAPIAIQSFAAGGPYTVVKPTGCTLMEVVLIGAGAGGQGGGGDGTGGKGGPGGGRLATMIPVSSAQFDLTLTVGAGGTGGAGGSGAPGAGSPGADTTLVLADPAATLTLKATGAQPAQGTGNGSPGLGSVDGQVAFNSYTAPVSDLRPTSGGRGASDDPGLGPYRAARGGGKHRQFLTGRVNLVKNPNFDYGLNTWENRTNSTLTWHTSGGATSPAPGIECCGVTVVATATSEIQQIDTGVNAIPVVPGGTLTAQVKVFTPNAGRNYRLGIGYWDAAGGALTSSIISGAMTQGAWSWRYFTHVAPANAAYARVIVGMENGVAGEVYLVDHVMLEQSAIWDSYFDGDFPTSGGVTYDWAGTNAGGNYSTAYSEDVSLTLARRGGGIGGDGGTLSNPGANGNGPGAGGGGGGANPSHGVPGGTGGRGGDGAAWIIFY